ncbi:MAG TPA: DinB family protein [Virgibacillus sp.]|nr:DinB family protein [Virgibacillus sp.]
MESLNLFKYSRAATLILLSKIEEHKWDVQPENFPNTIRWNAGHVYITAEDFLNKADHNYKVTPPEWVDLFLDGTRPSEWKDKDVPSVEEIIAALKEQEDRIYHHFNGKQQNKASEDHIIRTLNLNTVEAALQFVTWHEGIHLGIMKSLSDVLE